MMLRCLGATVLALAFASHALALSLSPINDYRSADANSVSVYFDYEHNQLVYVDVGNHARPAPGAARFDAEVPAPGTSLGTVSQHSEIGGTFLEGSGVTTSITPHSDPGTIGAPSFQSMFWVDFVLDVDAVASLSGQLYSEPGAGVVPNGSDSAVAVAYFRRHFVDPFVDENLSFDPGTGTERSFGFEGVLPRGDYTLQIYSTLNPAPGASERPLTVGWSFRLDVRPVPEPASSVLAVGAAFAIALAAMLRGWTPRSIS